MGARRRSTSQGLCGNAVTAALCCGAQMAAVAPVGCARRCFPRDTFCLRYERTATPPQLSLRLGHSHAPSLLWSGNSKGWDSKRRSSLLSSIKTMCGEELLHLRALQQNDRADPGDLGNMAPDSVLTPRHLTCFYLLF